MSYCSGRDLTESMKIIHNILHTFNTCTAHLRNLSSVRSNSKWMSCRTDGMSTSILLWSSSSLNKHFALSNQDLEADKLHFVIKLTVMLSNNSPRNSAKPIKCACVAVSFSKSSRFSNSSWHLQTKERMRAYYFKKTILKSMHFHY